MVVGNVELLVMSVNLCNGMVLYFLICRTFKRIKKKVTLSDDSVQYCAVTIWPFFHQTLKHDTGFISLSE